MTDIITYEAYVDGIGCIGRFCSKARAVEDCRAFIKSVGRASGPWHVIDINTGCVVAERHRKKGEEYPFTR